LLYTRCNKFLNPAQHIELAFRLAQTYLGVEAPADSSDIYLSGLAFLTVAMYFCCFAKESKNKADIAILYIRQLYSLVYQSDAVDAKLEFKDLQQQPSFITVTQNLCRAINRLLNQWVELPINARINSQGVESLNLLDCSFTFDSLEAYCVTLLDKTYREQLIHYKKRPRAIEDYSRDKLFQPEPKKSRTESETGSKHTWQCTIS